MSLHDALNDAHSAYVRPPPPQKVIDRHVCEPGDEVGGVEICMAYWCRKPVGPPCQASIQAPNGTHCIHYQEDLKAPCCKCGRKSADDQDETPCDPEAFASEAVGNLDGA